MKIKKIAALCKKTKRFYRDYLVSMASMARECLEEMDLQETRKQNQTEVITFDDLLKEKEDSH